MTFGYNGVRKVTIIRTVTLVAVITCITKITCFPVLALVTRTRQNVSSYGSFLTYLLT